jgi:hypothetical protein
VYNEGCVIYHNLSAGIVLASGFAEESMRTIFIRRSKVLLAAVLALLVLGTGVVAADDDDVPAPHRAITEYTGPETCALCHISAARDVVQSLHYQHQGVVPYREGWDEEVLGGMYVTY